MDSVCHPRKMVSHASRGESPRWPPETHFLGVSGQICIFKCPPPPSHRASHDTDDDLDRRASLSLAFHGIRRGGGWSPGQRASAYLRVRGSAMAFRHHGLSWPRLSQPSKQPCKHLHPSFLLVTPPDKSLTHERETERPTCPFFLVSSEV